MIKKILATLLVTCVVVTAGIQTDQVSVDGQNVTPTSIEAWDTINTKMSIDTAVSLINDNTRTLQEIALTFEAQGTWLATPFSQFLADAFTDQTWYNAAHSTNVYWSAGGKYYAVSGVPAPTYAIRPPTKQKVAATTAFGQWHITNAFTVAFWDYYNWLENDDMIIALTEIPALDPSSSPNMFNVEIFNDGRIGMECRDDRSGSGRYGIVKDANVLIPGWNHIVATWNGSQGHFYVNNVDHYSEMTEYGTGRATDGLSDTSRAFVITSTQNRGNNSTYEELQLYNYCMNAAQVGSNYNGGAGIYAVGNELGLVTVYHFDNVVPGGTTPDSGPYGHTMNISNDVIVAAGLVAGTMTSPSGIIQANPWSTVNSNNLVSVTILVDKTTLPATTNFAWQESIDNGSHWSNMIFVMNSPFRPIPPYYELHGSQLFDYYGTSVLYRAVWSNNESLKLKGVVQYVQDYLP